MTAPRAAIVFNASTGSDTAASGLGPATAVTGTAAAHTGGSASTTITLTNTPDLSGVQAGDLLWLDTPSGRQYSVIASADDGADTVTVDDSFTIDAGSPVNYAIGGKRATFDHADSRTLFSDYKAGWIVETETDQTLNTSGLTLATTGLIVRGSSGHKVITQTANTFHFTFTARVRFAALQFANSNGTKTSANALLGGSNGIVLAEDCIFGHATNTLRAGWRKNSGNDTGHQFVGCDFLACTTAGIDHSLAGSIGVLVDACLFKDCAIGINCNSSNLTLVALRSQFVNGTGDGIVWASSNFLTLIGNLFYGQTGDGVELTGAAPHGLIHNNIFASNGGYGLNGSGVTDPSRLIADYNDYHNNTSGARNVLAAGANDLALDPQFTNAAGLDFSIGTNLKAKGFPLGGTRVVGAGTGATYSYADIGAAQRQEAGGAGGRACIIGA